MHKAFKFIEAWATAGRSTIIARGGTGKFHGIQARNRLNGFDRYILRSTARKRAVTNKTLQSSVTAPFRFRCHQPARQLLFELAREIHAEVRTGIHPQRFVIWSIE